MNEIARKQSQYTILVRFFSKSDVTVIELPDQLQFIVVEEQGFLSLTLSPMVLVVFLVMGIMRQQWILVLFAVIGALSLVAYWLNGPVTKLFVSATEVFASGNLRRNFTTEIRIPANELKSLGYSSGGEDDPVVLYAWRGWGSVCLLPNLSREKAQEIADTIRKKFPDLEQGDRSGKSLLYDDGSGFTTLGIS